MVYAAGLKRALCFLPMVSWSFERWTRRLTLVIHAWFTRDSRVIRVQQTFKATIGNFLFICKVFGHPTTLLLQRSTCYRCHLSGALWTYAGDSRVIHTWFVLGMLFILDKTAMKHLRRNLKLVIPLFAVKLSPEWYPKADFDICASVIHACHVCVPCNRLAPLKV